MRIATIFVRYGVSDYEGAEEKLAETFRRRLPDVERYTVVVDNALGSPFAEAAVDRAVVSGDNTMREFSAFDIGVKYLGRRIWDFDFVHLATSAFDTLYTAYLDRFDSALLRAISDRPACLGHVDCYNEPVEVYSHRSQHWLRTCFVVLPPSELKALGSLVSVRDRAPFFSGDPSQPFRKDAPLSDNYKQLIQDWLVGRDSGQGVSWHSGFALTPQTLPGFEQKALSILNEHLFAIRLRAQGCGLVDVTWLSNVYPNGSGESAPRRTDFRRQLAERGADALVIS